MNSHLILDRVFPTIKGPIGEKSNLKTAERIWTILRWMFMCDLANMWASGSLQHDSLAHNNSLDISPSVKQGDWISLNRRTCERNVNTHLRGPIIQIRLKSLSWESSQGYLEIWFLSHMIYCTRGQASGVGYQYVAEIKLETRDGPTPGPPPSPYVVTDQ